jgi:hypothetical protein
VISRLVLGLVTSVVVVVAAGPAYADEWRAPDPRHDVVRYQHDPHPAPCGTTTVQHLRKDASTDITGLVVSHLSAEVRVIVHFRDLGQRRQFTEIPLRTDGKTYTLDVDRWRRGGAARSSLTTWRPPKHVSTCGAYGQLSVDEPCDGLVGLISAAHDRIVAHIPRGCLGNPRWVRAGASTARPHHGGTRYDDWHKSDATLVKYLGYLGPRVHHD